MKLAFCLFTYFPYGGLQRDFLRLARYCRAQGHDIDVYTMSWEGEREPGFHIHLIPVTGWQNHTRIKQFIAQCKPALTDGRYDAVIGFNKMPYLHVYYAADVCYQARIVESKSFWYRWLPRYRYYQRLEESVFAKTSNTHILLLSAIEQAKYQRYYQTAASRFQVLPPAIHKFSINKAEVKRQQIRTTYEISDQDYLLLMVGSGFKTKGVDRAIRAVAALPESLRSQCHLFIIGRDNPAPFQRLAKQLQVSDHIQFLGARSDVPCFLQAADLLLQPSYHENTGTAILEALVAGLPVLTLAVCGYAHYVEEANAGMVLPPPYSQATFNKALVTLLSHVKAKVLSENAVAFATKANIYDNSPQFLLAVCQAAKLSMPSSLHTNFYVHTSIRAALPNDHAKIANFMGWQGERFRQQKNRLTQRLDLAGIPYFIKQHYGVGWREVFKNLSQAKLPILGAKNEWLALNYLHRLGVNAPIPLGYGTDGVNPAKLQSFIVLEALTKKISLEDLCAKWSTSPPSIRFKRALIAKVAEIARILHNNGINHRDFYLCHFLLDTETLEFPKLYLIDLHRAQIRSRVPLRWRIKDLAGLYFSSLDIGLSQRDLYYFIKQYSQASLRDNIINHRSFWKKVILRGNELYQKHQG